MTIRIKNRGEWNEYYVHSETGWSFEINEDKPLAEEIKEAHGLAVAAAEWLAFLEDKAQTREAALKIADDIANKNSDLLARLSTHKNRTDEEFAQFVPGPVIEALEQNPGVWSRILGDR